MKIVIVGGGTAGWLSALFMSKLHPNHEYTLVQDSSSGPIGVGEGSTGLLDDVVQNRIFDTGGDVHKFIEATGSVPKLGIEFKGWSNKDFFSPIDPSATFEYNPDILTLRCVERGIPAWKSSNMGLIYAHDRLPFYDIKDLDSDFSVAWHFDGNSVSEYFRSLCKNVNVVEGEIVKVNRPYGFVTSVVCRNEIEVSGDFFHRRVRV